MGRVENKTALVTGGALGIGRAACMLLSKEGATVAVTDIQDQQGKDLVAEIRNSGNTAYYWHVDVTEEHEVHDVFSDIFHKFGRLDILVNNAGIPGIDKPTEEIETEFWDKVIRTNLKSVFLCTKHAVPFMKKRGGGSIINISSIYGLVGGEDPAYHAAKGGVTILTKSDATYYAKDNIRVNSVHPAMIWTPLLEEIASRDPQGIEHFKTYTKSNLPIGHLGEPDDVAYGILYLASDESKYVTGIELVIDGGYTAQ